ncbi:MAG: site-2 protease family protein [Thaumarchaeota archaeon]|nr:site-2 protease family protein [Nitrososphaerota archaeon]
MEKEYKPITFTYGIVMLRTRRGLSLMESLGKRRITKPLAWFMLFLMPISGGLAIYLVLQEVLIFFSPSGPAVISYIRTITPLANLLLPGINPYVPIVYGWIAIVVAVVIHEASHGIVARSLGLPVKSAGLIFFFIVPLGAFVEVDESQLRETKARNSLRVLAAGSGINFIVGLVCLALLILSVAALVPAANGSAIIGVEADAPGLPSPALHAGIMPGDFIVAIDGTPNNDIGSLTLQPFQVVNITIWRSGQTMVLPNVKLGETIQENTQTHQNITHAYLGVTYSAYQTLANTAHTYANDYTRQPIVYFLLPAFPNVAYVIPFSAQLSGFYTSPLGSATPIVENLLFWLFFVNFNLAIFNNLPIYPMDGGQALERFLVGAGKGRISDEVAKRITLAVTILLVLTLAGVVGGPYLSAYL